MNIREVIEKLHDMAERLPNGLDSEVRVHICNQNEPGLMTASIEVDTMWTYNKDNVMTHGFAIVQGHPHRDEGSGKIELSFIDGVPLLPGAANAVAAGCICNPERNNYGRGRPYDDGVQMVVKDDCPVHPKVNAPTDPDSE